jgi:pyridoxamine 5'-phosphate oxidase
MKIPKQDNPFDLFRLWSEEAGACPEIADSSALTLATVDGDGMPSARVMLLKGLDERGFTFYTNLGSVKAGHLEAHPKAALCFFWMPLGKQVRTEGPVERVTEEEADVYFASRPRESQIGAWASRQSEALPSREALEERIAEAEKEFAGGDVPRPSFWSGFRLVPNRIEFWLSRPHRLHDRLQYTRQADGGWKVDGLYP